MRRAIDRINAKNEECLDLPIVDVVAQFAQRFAVIDGALFHWRGVVQRRTEVAERSVDGVGQRMNFRVLLFACDD